MEGTPRTYPEPPPFSWSAVCARPLLPIYPPPHPLALPGLPSPARSPSITDRWALSTHIVPACYLRTTRMVPEPNIPAHGEVSKVERAKKIQEVRHEMNEIRTEGSWVNDGYPQVLWNCLNRYARRDLKEGKKGVTLIMMHANGFPKEIFEPTLQELFSRRGAELVEEVWVWESVQHGDAAVINAGALSGMFDWNDNARDILNFLLHFLPSQPTSGVLPTHLARVALDESERRKADGFAGRALVAVGHSYGGCSSVLSAAHVPALFSALYLIDPVILNPSSNGPDSHLPTPEQAEPDLAVGALARRSAWPSRREALAQFSSSAFFNIWDKRVLDVYVECGLCPEGEKNTAVRLKTPPTQEAAVFVSTITGCAAWDALSTLPESIALRWAMPGRPGARDLGGPGEAAKRVWVRRARAGNVRIQGGGHLIPQEAPGELATDLGEYLVYLFGPGGEATTERLDKAKGARLANL